MGADPGTSLPAPERLRPLSRIEILLLLFLAGRLVAWAFLLRPWGGFDEYAHHGYVETWAEQPRWRRFESVYVPDRLVLAERGWRTRGQAPEGTAAPPIDPPFPARRGNYETLQAPAYYLGAGTLIRLLPSLSPVAELYVLRLANAALALLVGLATLAGARRIGFGARAWLPVALLGFVPGFAIALVRVSNDALCAFCLAIGIGASLEDSRGRRRPLLAAAATGAAPWAKLYGVAGIPGVLARALRRGERHRAVSAALLLLPVAALALLSRRIHGSAIALAEVLTRPGPVAFRDVPWLRDAWTVVKTHLWVSGMSVRVFPTAVYVVLAAGLAACAIAAAASGTFEGRDRRNPASLAIPVAVFVAALAYFAKKNFASYRSPGGVGGWYLWAMALPEALLLALGFVRGPRGRRWFPILLSGFLILTVAGDLALFAEPSGLLATTNGHISGLRGSFAGVAEAFRRTRPAPAAIAAEIAAPLSWILGVWGVAAAFRADRA
jgi:hypothetical protein